ncbi:glycosyltransferase family 2 protein [Escherichia coli]|uniref:glycosyltransferase family 2 protein n=1 Tax=Escherichia coli TaxID=562 RepID=UPI000BB663CB|nr:glycosyltransferase family 2 protein [Escherichia coli]EFG7988722.1 glycosyltransferase family 2 protein [Escherichia coli]EGF1604883.1 glycosyltransferase family 2 protein [Escherichia coli]EGH1377162.1 glycosyltransferase family 2 protein [Escherichia coli]EGO3799418.1 glycosyltransferase family 2 protein [Escherichia coli]MBE3316116.1 glycosyltransferase family 2 protein [Escherichia coli]
MKIFISIVSHGHGDLIKRINCLAELNKLDKVTVIIKNNIKDLILIDYVKKAGIKIIDKQYGLGFGENNNVNFLYCKNHLGMEDDDIFIVMNPDVCLTESELLKLLTSLEDKKILIATINLIKDVGQYDPSIRNFPSLATFFSSFVLKKNKTIIDKTNINKRCFVEWAAGSFIIFRASYYFYLEGFNERYFMYCEDIDICYRSACVGNKVLFIPDIYAIHLAKHANRKLFSKHFYWHFINACRFIISKHIPIPFRSRLCLK